MLSVIPTARQSDALFQSKPKMFLDKSPHSCFPGDILKPRLDKQPLRETLSPLSRFQSQYDSSRRCSSIADCVIEWSRENRVQLNSDKCKELRISFSKRPGFFDPIVMDPLHDSDHMVQKPPYWDANYPVRHLKQRKFRLTSFVLDVPVRNLRSNMAVFVPCDHYPAKGPLKAKR